MGYTPRAWDLRSSQSILNGPSYFGCKMALTTAVLLSIDHLDDHRTRAFCLIIEIVMNLRV